MQALARRSGLEVAFWRATTPSFVYLRSEMMRRGIDKLEDQTEAELPPRLTSWCERTAGRESGEEACWADFTLLTA